MAILSYILLVLVDELYLLFEIMINLSSKRNYFLTNFDYYLHEQYVFFHQYLK